MTRRRPRPSALPPAVSPAVAVAVAVAVALTVGFAAWAVVLWRSERPVPLPERMALAADALRGLTVVIDPGHGGDDPGAVRDDTAEATLAYRTASELAAVVRAAGGTPVWTVRSTALLPRLTEDGDQPPLVAPTDASPVAGPKRRLTSGADHPEDLYDRAQVAADQWARRGPSVVFLSLHYDARTEPGRRGGGVYIDTRQAVRPACARAIGRRFRAHGLGGGLHRRDLGVLNPDHNPVPERMLLELATLTNDGDRRAATTAAWRWRVVRLIAASLADCRPRG